MEPALHIDRARGSELDVCLVDERGRAHRGSAAAQPYPSGKTVKLIVEHLEEPFGCGTCDFTGKRRQLGWTTIA